MKPTLLLGIFLLAGAAGSALGQGTMQWGNFFSGTLLAPVYGPIPNYPTCRRTGNTPSGIPAGTQDYAGAPRLSGTGFTLAIFVGSSAGEAEASFFHLGTTSSFRSGGAAGLVFAQDLTDPLHPPGTTGLHVQFRVWDNRGGTITSWAQVLASGGNVSYGYSDVFTLGPLGGRDPFGVDHQTPQTTGARSFNMFVLSVGSPDDFPGCPVPEPSTWALLATAAGLLFVRRRR